MDSVNVDVVMMVVTNFIDKNDHNDDDAENDDDVTKVDDNNLLVFMDLVHRCSDDRWL